MRKAIGAALVLTGGLLLASVTTVYARGAVARDAARARWEAAEAARAMRVGDAELAIVSVGARPALGAPVARLRVAAIGLDEIVVEGVGFAELNAGPGHLPGSVLPGDAGNSVISAHRDRHFHRLDHVQIGDTITTDTGHHGTRWVVFARKVVSSTAPALRQTSGPMLTLTTCWPVRYAGPAPDRLLVFARPVTASPARS